MPSAITYRPKSYTGFTKTLKKRVNQYFKENDISPKANNEMYLKTIIMFALYIIPYSIIIISDVPNIYALLLCVLMGMGKAGVGLCVMHDANHQSYSKNKKLNLILGYTLNLIGASAITWKIKHNIFHHTHTNIYGEDEDLTSGSALLRFSPHSKKYTWNKYQHLYAVILYSLFTLNLLFFSDFTRLFRYQKEGLFEKYRYDFKKELILMIMTKTFYCCYMIILPIYLLKITLLQFLIGFLIIHFTASVILILSFVATHIIETSLYPLPNTEHNINQEWSIHQLQTTANFSTKNCFITWFIGALNFQIEHHLFPNVCHVHYRKIAPIIKATAQEYALPYYEYPSLWSILSSHFRLLKKLGK